MSGLRVKNPKFPAIVLAERLANLCFVKLGQLRWPLRCAPLPVLPPAEFALQAGYFAINCQSSASQHELCRIPLIVACSIPFGRSSYKPTLTTCVVSVNPTSSVVSQCTAHPQSGA